jgi:K+ potassium transporter
MLLGPSQSSAKGLSFLGQRRLGFLYIGHTCLHFCLAFASSTASPNFINGQLSSHTLRVTERPHRVKKKAAPWENGLQNLSMTSLKSTKQPLAVKLPKRFERLSKKTRSEGPPAFCHYRFSLDLLEQIGRDILAMLCLDLRPPTTNRRENRIYHAAISQIYISQINTLLALGCIALVIGFRKSEALASAYGIAVTLTMLATTLLLYFAARRMWKWSRIRSGSAVRNSARGGRSVLYR